MHSEETNVATQNNVQPPSLEDIQAAFDHSDNVPSPQSGEDDTVQEIVELINAMESEEGPNENRGTDPPIQTRSRSVDVEQAQVPDDDRSVDDEETKQKRRKRDLLIAAIALIVILLGVSIAIDVRITVAALLVIILLMILADERVQGMLWW